MDYTIFVKSYKVSNNKDEFVKRHIVKEYLGYEEKVALAKKIANYSSHILGEDGQLGAYKRDTMLQYLLTQMDIIAKYTDIEVPSELMVGAYDSLSECGAINDIFHYIKESEIKIVNTMVQMAMDDTYMNEQDLSVVLTTKFEAIKQTIDTALVALQKISENTEEPTE